MSFDPSKTSGRLVRNGVPWLAEMLLAADKALQAVIVEAYVKGVSTRKVADRKGARD